MYKRQEYDLSILLSTHDFATLGQFADKVILLNKRVLKAGPPDEVLSSPEFYQTCLLYTSPLVGLSALMTTTLKSMEDTIALLHQEGLTCRVVVGGAVLTPEYAKQIGADFYAKDAKESVDVARQVIG